MARIRVVGTYADEKTYVLTKQDGSVYMTIKEGESFYTWHMTLEVPITGGIEYQGLYYSCFMGAHEEARQLFADKQKEI